MRSYGLRVSFLRTVIPLDIYPSPPSPAPHPRDCFAGHGTCSCGHCVCERGWFGKLCQHPRKCNMTEEQSKSLCESADGILCSGKGEYLCGSLDLVPVPTHGLQGSTYHLSQRHFVGMKTTLSSAPTRLQTCKLSTGSVGSEKMKCMGRFSCKKVLGHLRASSWLSDM